MTGAYKIVDETAHSLGCELIHISCTHSDSGVAWTTGDSIMAAKLGPGVSGPSAIFRLSGGQGLWITVSLGLPADSPLAADIVFRYLQRLCQALAERLERFQSSTSTVDEIEERLDLNSPGPQDSARGGLGVIAAIFDRVVARSGPDHDANVKSVSSNRTTADALARPASGTRG
jgi:hypothetical protein